MRRAFGVLTLFTALLLPLTATAQQKAPERVDMRAYTCAEFLKEKQLGMVLTLFWLDGYASAKSGDMILDARELDHYGEIMIRQCTKTPKAKVLDVFHAYAKP